ncbi:MAG: Na(+)-translocating NADH-quinone reductase subunit C [Planctomycetota bacterium]
MSRDSVGKILLVAFSLCVVCSVMVSSTAVALKDKQQTNVAKDRKRNVLVAAGLVTPDQADVDVDAYFENIEARVYDLDTGKVADVKAADFDAEKALKAEPHAIPAGVPGGDKVKARSKQQVVYLVKTKEGALDAVVLPIQGLGLWSTLKGFLALEADLVTVRGLVYYDQKETPGLGGEVDNPIWRAQWPGKKLFDADGSYHFTVVKGPASGGDPHKADGISGATITCNGVDGMLRYWMSADGYGPVLENLGKGVKRDG